MNVLDGFEYSTDIAAQNAYNSNQPSNVKAYSEATVKVQGSYALKVIANTGCLNAMLTRTLNPF